MTVKCLFSCEIQKQAQETYSKNFNETPFSDIKKCSNLPEHDILLAGFPCQAFSYAGKRKGFGDTRGTLFFEIERLLCSLRKKPEYLFLENVRGFATHDSGRTFKTVLKRLELLGYETVGLILNSSNFGVPQNRMRVYIVAKYGVGINLGIKSNLGFSDSHKLKVANCQKDLFCSSSKDYTLVEDILEESVDSKYQCSTEFIQQLRNALGSKSFNELHGVRLIDYRGGSSLHSWDLGIKGQCSEDEREFMNCLIFNRRKKHFGAHQDGKKLSKEQISTFWNKPNLDDIIASLLKKGYLGEKNGLYNPVAGNMSFEVFKFLDPKSISITVVSSDANRLGVVQNEQPRRITPRECARLQGFPNSFQLHSTDKWSYHQLGNSVSVPVVSAIFDDLFTHNAFSA